MAKTNFQYEKRQKELEKKKKKEEKLKRKAEKGSEPQADDDVETADTESGDETPGEPGQGPSVPQ